MLELLGGSMSHDSDHPVYNFVFEYYHFKKSQALLDYSPGVESPTALLLPASADAASTALRLLAGRAQPVSGLPLESGAAALMWIPPPLGAQGWTEKHMTSLRFGREVLKASAERPPSFYCYGGKVLACLRLGYRARAIDG